MGEVAEMVLEGIYCESCFAIIDGKEVGHPRICEDCEEGSE